MHLNPDLHIRFKLFGKANGGCAYKPWQCTCEVVSLAIIITLAAHGCVITLTPAPWTPGGIKAAFRRWVTACNFF